MRFSIIAILFALVGLSSGTVHENRQLQACPPGRKTYCSMDDCKAACEGCTMVGKDYGGSTCGSDVDAWACSEDC
ncbi:hypothetical protein FB107DRAFT_273932 [Schizophyllum commune]